MSTGGGRLHSPTNYVPAPYVQWPSGFFLVGVALVLLSVFMYGRVVSGQAPTAALRWCKKVSELATRFGLPAGS